MTQRCSSFWQGSSECCAHPSKWHEALGVSLQRLATAFKPPRWLEVLSILSEVVHSKTRALDHELHCPALHAQQSLVSNPQGDTLA